jgi:thiamine biosynthesis lipoprotein
MWTTFVSVTVYSTDEALAQNAIDAAFDRMAAIGDITSSFEENSQTSQLNQNGYLDNPAPEMLKLVNDSIEFSTLTNGSFDITVQPILELWSEGLWMETEQVQQQRIDEKLPLVGSDKIVTSDTRISYSVDGMEITLGGITKGYAADEALKVISNKGINHAVIAVSGDIRTLGTKPDGQPWQIDMVNPDDTSESLATFEFADKAISTSGNYERYFSPDKSAHHITDPNTGYSANESISVTIIADTGLEADALATGVFVMGPEDGLELVESLDDVEAYIVDSQSVIHRSSGIGAYIVQPS